MPKLRWPSSDTLRLEHTSRISPGRVRPDRNRSPPRPLRSRQLGLASRSNIAVSWGYPGGYPNPLPNINRASVSYRRRSTKLREQAYGLHPALSWFLLANAHQRPASQRQRQSRKSRRNETSDTELRFSRDTTQMRQLLVERFGVNQRVADDV